MSDSICFIYCILAGMVHSITEFFAIDSAAHVVIFRQILQQVWSFTLDMSFHIGAVLGVIVFYRSRFQKLMLGLKDLCTTTTTQNRNFFLTWTFACLPSVIAIGITERLFFVHVGSVNPMGIFALSTILCGAALLFCDQRPSSNYIAGTPISRKHYLIVGLVQMLSIIPGMSGICLSLSAMRYFGYSREESFIHSLLLYVPITASTIVFKSWDFVFLNYGHSFIGATSSFLFALFSISVIVRFLKKCTFTPIAGYKMFFGTCVGILVLYLNIHTFSARDEEFVDYYLNRIEEVSTYKMSALQRKEIHNFFKENLLCDKNFANKDVDLRDMLKEKNVKFVSYPGILSVNPGISAKTEFEQIKQEFIEKSQVNVPSDTEWAFVLHSRMNEFSDGICEWWNLVPAPPIKLCNKTAFIYRDCFRNESLFSKNLHRFAYKYLNWLVTALNYINISVHTK